MGEAEWRRDWMKSYFHLYSVSYANGKYMSHGLRLYSQLHLFVNLSLAPFSENKDEEEEEWKA